MKLAISTNKGGVLKSSLTVNLAGLLLAEGKRVLIVDADNQGNVALSFGKNPDKLPLTLYDVLLGGVPAHEAIETVEGDPGSARIDILGSNDEMAFFDFDVLTDLEKYPAPFVLLREALAPVLEAYDVILIDSPPNLGLTQGNVLTAADSVLIPFQPEAYSMRSLVKILETIHNFREDHNPALSVLGVVGTLVDRRTVIHSEILEEVRRYGSSEGVRVFDTIIPRSVKFATSVAYDSRPLSLSRPGDPIVAFYRELLGELHEGGVFL